MAMLFYACEKEPLVIEEVSSKSVSSGYWSKHLPATYDNVLSDKIVLRDSAQQQPYPSLDLLLHIAGELEAADSAGAFIEDMVDAFGIPLWNYSIIKGSENSDYIVSIPFDRVTDDTTISGILKYYYFDNEAGFVFIARSELDSLIQSPPDTSDFGGYMGGIFFDFLIFEFNLFENFNPQFFDYLEDVAHIQSDLVLPRTTVYCIRMVLGITEHINYIQLQEGGTTLIAASFTALLGQAFELWIQGSNGAYLAYDCSKPNDGFFYFYSDIGTNWRDWSEFFQWYLNNVGPSGGSGSGSGSGTPPPPPPTPIQQCLEGNFLLMAAADRMRDELVDACDPSFDADQAVDDALMAACDDTKPNQLKSFYKALPNRAHSAYLLKVYVGAKIQEHPEDEAELLAFQATFNELACAEPDIRADRAIELFELLEEDEYALIRDCANLNGIDLQDFQDLLGFVPPQSSHDRINLLHEMDSRWKIQPITAGNVAVTNVDDYSVEITSLPGNVNSMQELWDEVRDKFSDIASGSADDIVFQCPFFGSLPTGDPHWSFEYYFPSDETRWFSQDPLNTIFKIPTGVNNASIPFLNALADDGCVMVTQHESCCFINTSIESPFSETQPYSGHRMFGWRINSSGNMEIYTRAIDIARRSPELLWMPGAGDEQCQSDTYYDIADATWQNFQDEIHGFVNGGTQPGNAIIQPAKVAKFSTAVILNLLKATDKIMSVPCE